jgi:hypothetical protein
MIRVFQWISALISVLLLVLMAARAESAPWQEPDPGWQAAPVNSTVSPAPRPRLVHRLLTPAPQPGTHFDSQPFAYGYFGARARPVSAYQRSYDADWYQWTFYRAD